MFRKLRELLAPSSVALTALAGCSLTAVGGQEILLVYPHSLDLPDDEVRVGLQTQLDVRVQARDAKKIYTAAFTKAASSDEAVLAATLVDAQIVRIEPRAAGEAVVTFDATISPGGKAATQKLKVVVAAPARVALQRVCGEGPDAEVAYLLGQPLRVGLEVFDAEGKPLVGVGAAPVTASAGAKVEEGATWGGELVVTPAAAGELELRATVGDHALTMRVIEASQIDGIKLTSAPMRVGERQAIGVSPTAGGVPLCQASQTYEVEVSDAQVCDAEVEIMDGMGAVVQLDAKAAGTCRVTVRSGALSAAVEVVVAP
jgi:hypothetical protein